MKEANAQAEISRKIDDAARVRKDSRKTQMEVIREWDAFIERFLSICVQHGLAQDDLELSYTEADLVDFTQTVWIEYQGVKIIECTRRSSVVGAGDYSRYEFEFEARMLGDDPVDGSDAPIPGETR